MSLATLPEELLLIIFNHARNESISLTQLAFTSRRLYNLLQAEFQHSFHARSHGRKPSNGNGGWIWSLQHILRQPILGTYLKNITFGIEDLDIPFTPPPNFEVSTAVDWDASDANEKLSALPWNPSPAFKEWTEDDWELADRQIDRLCGLDVWDAGKFTSFPLDQAVLHWQTHLRTGRHEAVFALLLALAFDVETLSIDSVVEFSDKHPTVLPFRAEHYDRFDTRVGPDADYISRLFRRARNSQLRKAGREDATAVALLSKLHTIKLSTELMRLPENTMATQHILPYLLLPSLRAARITCLHDEKELPEYEVPAIEAPLSLTSLEIQYSNLTCDDIGVLLSACPSLEHFHCSSDGEDDHWTMWYPAELMPFLLEAAPTLKHLSLGNCNRENRCGFHEPWNIADSTWSSRSGEAKIGELSAFPNLVSLTLQTSYIFGHDLSEEAGALWRELPRSLESFGFACGKQAFSRVVEELNTLKAAQQERWVPNLKEIVIIRGRDTYDLAFVPSDEDKEVLRRLRKMVRVAIREEYFVRREFLQWIE